MTTLAPILDTHGVADLLKCSPCTVEARARAGTLPGVQVGESWIFPTAALLEAVNEMARANTPVQSPYFHILARECRDMSEANQADCTALAAAVRNEALEEAARVCDEAYRRYGQYTFTARISAENIRSLKS